MVTSRDNNRTMYGSRDNNVIMVTSRDNNSIMVTSRDNNRTMYGSRDNNSIMLHHVTTKENCQDQVTTVKKTGEMDEFCSFNQ